MLSASKKAVKFSEALLDKFAALMLAGVRLLAAKRNAPHRLKLWCVAAQSKTAALKYDAASELWYESVRDFKRAWNARRR